MYTLSGSLKDIGLQPLTGLSPQLRFTPNQNAITPEGELLSVYKPAIVAPASDGSFSVELAGTDTLSPTGTYYRLQIRFRSPDGYGDGSGYTVVEFPDLKIGVRGDSTLIDSVDPARLASVVIWVGEDDDGLPPGTWWFQPSTGEIVEVE